MIEDVHKNSGPWLELSGQNQPPKGGGDIPPTAWNALSLYQKASELLLAITRAPIKVRKKKISANFDYS